MKVSLNNLGKKYEGRENFTLRHIDLVIEDKDFCVILGPSGCGKSTLLRMIAGLTSITEGDLYFDERKVNNVSPKDRDIAMVFQSYALYPHMTVYENMAFSLEMRRDNKKKIHERVLEAAETLQLSEYLYSKPSDISGGQRQRVALGRAIVRKPSVFLMDEPLSNLDAKLRDDMRVQLVRLHKELESTTIYVTHDQTEAMTMATKIILIDDGKIQQVGKPDDLYNRPENVFVARFIGSPTINIIEGSISSGVFVSEDKIINLKPSNKDIEKLKSYEGKKVYLGIRPERFEAKGELGDTFKCEIDVVEELGKEKILHGRLENGQELTISVPGYHDYKEGKIYSFGYNIEALHFFDGETTRRIN